MKKWRKLFLNREKEAEEMERELMRFGVKKRICAAKSKREQTNREREGYLNQWGMVELFSMRNKERRKEELKP